MPSTISQGHCTEERCAWSCSGLAQRHRPAGGPSGCISGRRFEATAPQEGQGKRTNDMSPWKLCLADDFSTTRGNFFNS